MPQGRAARLLLAYVAALPLSSPDAQLLAVMVVIRSARGGNGNITGQDLRSLRQADPAGAVEALRGLGWRIPDELLDGPPEVPVGVTVPALAAGTDHPLPLGKQVRSRVSGWSTRTLAAKPLKKAGQAGRLAALFLAAHSTSELRGTLPGELPESCRAGLPELLEKGFLAELSGEEYRLGDGVRHLAGRVYDPADPFALPPPTPPRADPPGISPADWTQWLATARPGLRKHAGAVESCAVCSLPFERVTSAFMEEQVHLPPPRRARDAYDAWKEKHPEHGEEAARFTIAFRAEHGHGPSYTQLCAGLGWKGRRSLKSLIVSGLLADGWLTDTSPVPWTLRPGATANAHGIALPVTR
ncbi:hypothetical protein [Streptomyces sp. NPDC089799]|uniref:hypothetical protein n=1 Tax=Streptomyces sp. NPDC089799 TaxID=3155066 RepID=UPI003414312F